MKSITFELPDKIDETEVKTLLASKLYEKGELSLGQAAALSGYTKRTFMELLKNYNVSIFNYTVEELEKELSNAKNYHS